MGFVSPERSNFFSGRMQRPEAKMSKSVSENLEKKQIAERVVAQDDAESVGSVEVELLTLTGADLTFR